MSNRHRPSSHHRRCTVTDGEEPKAFALEYLSDSPLANRIYVRGIKVDVIETHPLPSNAAELLDYDDSMRLFALGHRWALDTATPVVISAADATGTVISQASVDVATAPALLACKLRAMESRAPENRHKQESDARDIYRLTILLAQSASDPFAGAPFDLAELVHERVTDWLIDNATRTAGLISRGSGSGDSTIYPSDLAAAGELLSSRIA